MTIQFGTVKWYNKEKGYGFIKPDGDQPDVFVHFSDVEKSGIADISDDMRLSFELSAPSRSNKTRAVNLKLRPSDARNEKSLRDIFIEAIKKREAKEIELAPPPELPTQGAGPHFKINDDAVLVFESPILVDGDGNNISRMRSLQPVIVDAAKQVLAAVRSNEQPQLIYVAKEYLDLINRDVSEIDTARLYGVGLRLSNSHAAAKRLIEDRLLPPLEDSAAEALESLIALHGPFVLSTKAGRELLSDAERYTRKPTDEEAITTAALELGRKLESESQIADRDVGRFVREAAGELTSEDETEKVAVYSAATMKNITIVIIAGATLAALPIVGGVLAGPPGIAAGAIAMLLGNEGLKKSKSFGVLQEKITKGLDAAEGVEAVSLAKKLDPLRLFALRNEAILRKMAGTNPAFQWMHKYLDWIKAQSMPENDG